MDPDKRQEELAAKWLNGTITPAEKMEFSAWYNAHKDDHVELPESFSGSEEALKARILANVRKRMVKRLRLRRAVAIAAAMVLAGTIGLLLWQMQTDEHVEPSVAVHQDVQPGGNRASLTLADGRTIDLSETQEEIIVGEGITYADGTHVLGHDSAHLLNRKGASKSDITELSLATPKGGTYQVTLPDGSKVHLNAGSTLKYPSKFTDNERIVELVGEGYFTVSKDENRPFRVISKGQEVEVLGTEFNLSAYPEDSEVKTTLVKGSVHVASTTLKPGQQAVWTANEMHVLEVDTEVFTAWRDGYFHFNDADIYTVMKQFARWYNIEVEYEIKHSDGLFVGKIPRDVKLSTALSVLESAGVNFELREGPRLIVKHQE